MRVINLILHILSVILMLPVLVFVGINTLMGLGYLDGIELIIVPAIACLYGTAFLVSTIGSPINLAKYRSKGLKLYVKRELISHGICTLCFAIAIIYRIEDEDFWFFINLAGLVLCIVGLIFTVVCSKIIGKRAKAIAKSQVSPQVAPSVSRPRFCPECGKATGTAGDYCGSCGSRLVR